MPAYLVVEHIITDAVRFEEYRSKVAPLIASHGGRCLTKGSARRQPEGGHWKPERMRCPARCGTSTAARSSQSSCTRAICYGVA